MDFKGYLKTTASKIDREVEGILDVWGKEAIRINPQLKPLVAAFIKACQGGKRIRGSLVRLGFEIATGPSVLRNDVLRVGAAYEIFHTSILAHDDIIDQSPTRRGQPSLYQSVGISQAITLADFGFFLAISSILENNFPPKNKNQALKLFSKTMVDTTIGQMLDFLHADWEMVARLKTARYSISGPLQLGAILAGARGELLEKLARFGENLGIAFQIRDDILDSEALDNARQIGVKYVTQAKKLIPRITTDPQMIKLLTEMADFLVERKS